MSEIVTSSFDNFNEQQLAMILSQVGRRMLCLRVNTPDSAFWFSVLSRVSTWLGSSMELNDEEINYLADLDNGGKIKAIKSLRMRTGMRLYACNEIVNDWIKTNLNGKQ